MQSRPLVVHQTYLVGPLVLEFISLPIVVAGEREAVHRLAVLDVHLVDLGRINIPQYAVEDVDLCRQSPRRLLKYEYMISGELGADQGKVEIAIVARDAKSLFDVKRDIGAALKVQHRQTGQFEDTADTELGIV